MNSDRVPYGVWHEAPKRAPAGTPPDDIVTALPRGSGAEPPLAVPATSVQEPSEAVMPAASAAELPVVFGKYACYAAFREGLKALRVAGFSDAEVAVLCLADQHRDELRPFEWLSVVGAFPSSGMGTVLVAGGLAGTFRDVSTVARDATASGAENVTSALRRLGLHADEVTELAAQLRKGALLLGLLPMRALPARSLRQHLIAAGAQAVFSRRQSRRPVTP